ncbi:MAG: tetratricopeptide repeat protein [Treponema sp.]|nr:tetratricopeptide repeat protein [Treponema sp.]
MQRIFRPRPNKQEETDPDAVVMEKWDAVFSDPKNVRFDIKSESAYDAYLHKSGNTDCLVLGLRKAGCIAWIEDPLFRYGDLVIDGTFRLDSRGSYAAAGFLFRVVDERTCYSALISNKGYFRLDVLQNGMPLPLIGWTEVPGAETDRARGLPAADMPVSLKIIAWNSHIILAVNGIWAAEIKDSTISEGRICFAAACYDAPVHNDDEPYTAEAFLESFSVESRTLEVEKIYGQWENKADPRSCFHLAETFTAMNQPAAALIQLKKAWDDPACEKTQRELLLAARLALRLELLDEAETYIDNCIAAGAGTPLGREAGLERVKLLYIAKRYDELIAAAPEDGPGSGNGGSAEGACTEAAPRPEPSSTFYTLLGNVYMERNEVKRAARCYDEACRLDGSNGLAAKNAANAYELLGEKDEAIKRYLEAGRIFLSQDNYEDLGILVPKMLALDGSSREAHGLAGKWAFGVEDWTMAAQEFAEAERLRLALEPRPGRDPSLVFLQALLLIRQGKRPEALPLLEEAAALAPDFALFRFRLAESRFLLSGNSADPRMLADLEAALNLSSGEEDAPPDSGGSRLTCGWIHNLAAQTALGNNDLEGASRHLEKAAGILGEVPAIRVNRGGLRYLQGSLDKALAVLAVTSKDEDPEGMMSNCAGNLLVKAGRFEEADSYYQAALAAAPQNAEYICNRAACLIELGYYGEADSLLARLETMTPSALNLIAYIAIKKGEYQRAEAACKTALESDDGHAASLLSLGWIYTTLKRWDDARNILDRLNALPLSAEYKSRRDELKMRLEESLFKTVHCIACGRSWRILREPSPAPPIRLFAMPPDDLPAGTCPECGGVYCIACGKKNLDPEGRFLCPKCGKSLKLIDGGLKKLVYDWAAGALPRE